MRTPLAVVVAIAFHTLLAAVSAPGQSYTIYVSPPTVPPNPVPGNGSPSAPYSSLEEARDHIRLHPDRYAAHWYVKLRKNTQGNGVFQRTAPFVLEPQDSGGSGFRVDYQAGASSSSQPYDDILISGGYQVGNWAGPISFPLPSGVAMWTTYVNDESFRDVYFNNLRLTRARWPNLGPQRQEYFDRISWTDLYYFDNYRNYTIEHAFSRHPSQFEPVEMVARHRWISPRQVVYEIEQNTPTVTVLYFYHKRPFGWSAPCGQPTGTPSAYDFYFNTMQIRGRYGLDTFPSYAAPALSGPCDRGTEVFVENSLSFVDQCYEWYGEPLGNSTTRLWLCLPVGVNPNASGNTTTIPSASSLLELRSIGAAKVANVAFTRLNFGFTDAGMPAIRSKPGASAPPYACTTWEYGADTGYLPSAAGLGVGDLYNQGELLLPATILFDQTQSCLFRQCRVAHVGGHALLFNGNYNQITGCKFFDAGGSAIVGMTRTFPSLGSYNVIADNHISDFGMTYRDSPGVFVTHQHQGLVHGNWIARGPFNGVQLGTCAGACYIGQGNMSIVQNRVEDVMRIMTDGAAGYTTGNYPNSQMGGNWVRRTIVDSNYHTDLGSGASTLIRALTLRTVAGTFTTT